MVAVLEIIFNNTGVPLVFNPGTDQVVFDLL